MNLSPEENGLDLVCVGVCIDPNHIVMLQRSVTRTPLCAKCIARKGGLYQGKQMMCMLFSVFTRAAKSDFPIKKRMGGWILYSAPVDTGF